ncbi:hypothetical protein TREMEDRAFT_61929 [Tremella mesenterica DSM 1558]|uniref:uncharacterized protein n=1 Tax=Tremella mesenterica (strain ATCC 24925 / CBS 8224 / DSM 1558 / NBRC 9311 / NRRL Y-6157 / RJB 2259-6 / UBC 559-6) TaxID=578456 RepID=UPI0003F48CD5|nr:uncharacterized protein TREMEDRAFT_61929 [Tremella mesenterica DSM 1558]EIW70168.1 hypothetical protein TREMEDRAFT_61929 [Tremella mesenterica DSM 1558]
MDVATSAEQDDDIINIQNELELFRSRYNEMLLLSGPVLVDSLRSLTSVQTALLMIAGARNLSQVTEDDFVVIHSYMIENGWQQATTTAFFEQTSGEGGEVEETQLLPRTALLAAVPQVDTELTRWGPLSAEDTHSQVQCEPCLKLRRTCDLGRPIIHIVTSRPKTASLPLVALTVLATTD